MALTLTLSNISRKQQHRDCHRRRFSILSSRDNRKTIAPNKRTSLPPPPPPARPLQKNHQQQTKNNNNNNNNNNKINKHLCTKLTDYVKLGETTRRVWWLQPWHYAKCVVAITLIGWMNVNAPRPSSFADLITTVIYNIWLGRALCKTSTPLHNLLSASVFENDHQLSFIAGW